MKRMLIVAVVGALSSATVLGQTPSEKPAQVPAAATTGAAQPAPQQDIALVQGPGQSQVKEDARHCLERSSNTEITKCAEPYLPTRLRQPGRP
jgi:hypothetical protein